MGDHTHAEFGVIEEQLKNIDKNQDGHTSTLNKIFERIEGRNGITSEIAVLKNQFLSIPSIKTLIVYASIGGGLTSGALMAAKFLIKG